MRIVVSESEFTWADGGNQKAKRLRAPESCVFEPIEVWRDGAPIDTGAILYIPAVGYDGFEGFEAMYGEPAQMRVLEPSHFKPGDEIRINLLRGNINEKEYWAGLTATPP